MASKTTTALGSRKSGLLKIDSTCVFCGEPVPEGRLVCPSCEASDGQSSTKQKSASNTLSVALRWFHKSAHHSHK